MNLINNIDLEDWPLNLDEVIRGFGLLLAACLVLFSIMAYLNAFMHSNLKWKIFMVVCSVVTFTGYRNYGIALLFGFPLMIYCMVMLSHTGEREGDGISAKEKRKKKKIRKATEEYNKFLKIKKTRWVLFCISCLVSLFFQNIFTYILTGLMLALYLTAILELIILRRKIRNLEL